MFVAGLRVVFWVFLPKPEFALWFNSMLSKGKLEYSRDYCFFSLFDHISSDSNLG